MRGGNFSVGGRQGHEVTGLRLCGIAFCIWRSRQSRIVAWLFCVSGSADHHISSLRSSPSSITTGSCSSLSGLRRAHDASHGGQRRRITECGRLHFHGANRGAAYDPAVLTRLNALRIDDSHDQRNGARFGRNHGGIHSIRNRGETPVERGDHDGARNPSDGEDAGAGDRSSRKRRVES